MSDPVELSELVPTVSSRLVEIYEKACEIKAKLPETHIASLAANRLIAAFDNELAPSGTRDAWLSTMAPKGHA